MNVTITNKLKIFKSELKSLVDNSNHQLSCALDYVQDYATERTKEETYKMNQNFVLAIVDMLMPDVNDESKTLRLNIDGEDTYWKVFTRVTHPGDHDIRWYFIHSAKVDSSTGDFSFLRGSGSDITDGYYPVAGVAVDHYVGSIDASIQMSTPKLYNAKGEVIATGFDAVSKLTKAWIEADNIQVILYEAATALINGSEVSQFIEAVKTDVSGIKGDALSLYKTIVEAWNSGVGSVITVISSYINKLKSAKASDDDKTQIEFANEDYVETGWSAMPILVGVANAVSAVATGIAALFSPIAAVFCGAVSLVTKLIGTSINKAMAADSAYWQYADDNEDYDECVNMAICSGVFQYENQLDSCVEYQRLYNLAKQHGSVKIYTPGLITYAWINASDNLAYQCFVDLSYDVALLGADDGTWAERFGLRVSTVSHDGRTDMYDWLITSDYTIDDNYKTARAIALETYSPFKYEGTNYQYLSSEMTRRYATGLMLALCPLTEYRLALNMHTSTTIQQTDDYKAVLGILYCLGLVESWTWFTFDSPNESKVYELNYGPLYDAWKDDTMYKVNGTMASLWSGYVIKYNPEQTE